MSCMNKPLKQFCCSTKGPSIHDVHTKGEGGQAQVDACGLEGRGNQAPCGRPHRKLKLESTDAVGKFYHFGCQTPCLCIVSSNYKNVLGKHPVFFSCKEVGVFFTRISSLGGIKSGNFSGI